MTNMKRIILFTFLVVSFRIFVCVGSVYSSLIYPPNTYGLSARGIALGNALTGDDKDLSICYFNPAGLASGGFYGVGVGYIFTSPDLTGGYVDGDKIHEGTNNHIVLINVRADIRKLFSDTLPIPPIGFGLSLAMDDNFSTMMVFDDMRTYKGEFYRYGMANFTMQGAIGVGITKWMSMGIGFHGGFKGKGEVVTKADVTGGTANEGTRMRGAFKPHILGGLYFHDDAWGIGLTFRDHTIGTFESIKVEATPSISSMVLPTMHIPMNFFDTYVPTQVALGASWDISPMVSVLADLTWQDWSKYDKIASRSHFVGSHAKFDTVDIYSPRAGIEIHPIEQVALRSGYRFEQTPFRKVGTRFPEVSDTIKGKVILDNDTHLFSFGTGYVYSNPKVLAVDFGFDLTYQLHYFTPRQAETSDGYNYESSGLLHLISGSMEIRY